MTELILRGHFDRLAKEFPNNSGAEGTQKLLKFLEKISATLTGELKAECQQLINEYHEKHSVESGVAKRPMTRAGSRKRSDNRNTNTQ